jgi:hypothetical protein
MLPFRPLHPDPYVSESAAVLLVAACESRSVSLVRHTVTAVAALSCANEVITDLALHGAARLASLDTDEVTIAPWHFHKVKAAEGEAIWTFDIDTKHLARMYQIAERVGEDADEFELVLAELHRTGRTLCTAANEYADLSDAVQVANADTDGEQAQRRARVETERTREEVLAHWPSGEDERTTWAGIARLGMCVAEFAHLAWGNPVGFGISALTEDDDEPEG